MFSIIILFNEYKKESITRKFFSKLSSSIKTQKETEIIFIVENDYYIIDYIQEFQNDNPNTIVKFIYTNKRITLNKMLEKINKLITNDYFFFLSYPSEIAPGFFNNIIKIIDNNSPDIIEFKPSLTNFIRWNPNNRLDSSKFNKLLKLANNNDVVAFTFPFIFNKIFSSTLLNRTIKHYLRKTDSDNSNIFFTYLTYLMFLKANSYWYITNQLITFEVNEIYILNFNSIFTQWDIILEKFNIEAKYLEEINYAKFYYLKIILCSLYSLKNPKIKKIMNKNNSNDLNQKKYQDKLDQIAYSEFKDFYLKNKYMVLNNAPEISLLKQNISISKWSKLLKELEN